MFSLLKGSVLAYDSRFANLELLAEARFKNFLPLRVKDYYDIYLNKHGGLLG
jgi:hypothetical protein